LEVAVGVYIPIRIDKPSRCGIIIPTLQIIKSRFSVVVIASVSERIVGIGTVVAVTAADQVAPRIVGIACNLRTARVVDADDVALQILLVEIGGTVQNHADRQALCIIDVTDHIAAIHLRHDLRAVQDILDRRCADLLRADAVSVVAERGGLAVMKHRRKLTTLRPRQGIARTVVVALRVTQSIIRDARAVERRQLIALRAVAVGVSLNRLKNNHKKHVRFIRYHVYHLFFNLCTIPSAEWQNTVETIFCHSAFKRASYYTDCLLLRFTFSLHLCLIAIAIT